MPRQQPPKTADELGLMRGFPPPTNARVTHAKQLYALGYGGQILSIDPLAQLVVAKFSSYPTPVEGGREFFHAFAALSALANELGSNSC